VVGDVTGSFRSRLEGWLEGQVEAAPDHGTRTIMLSRAKAWHPA